MAKNALSDFDVTPGNNLDVASISVAEGWLPSTVNNAWRAQMAMLKSGVATGYTTTATAADTTTLTANSNSYQYFTGVTTQTITMPVTSTLETGRTFTFINNSTGLLTVNSSGANLITTVAAGAIATVQCILLTGTTAASWSVLAYSPFIPGGSDKGNASALVYTYADSGAAEGPGIELYRKSTTPAANDLLGFVRFTANNSQPASEVDYGGVFVTQTDPGSALHAGSSRLTLKSRNLSGTLSALTDSLILDGTSATFPSAGSIIFGANAWVASAAGAVLTVSTGDLRITTAGTNAASVVTVGGLATTFDLSNAAAGQIKFPASQNPSTNANTLDDYEEGTFTPRIDGSSAAGAGTYSAQTGTYTKIGNTVFYDVKLAWSAHTGTGNLQFGGFPFTVGTATMAYVYVNGLTVTGQVALVPVASGTTAQIISINNGTAAAIAMDTAVTTFNVTGFYYV